MSTKFNILLKSTNIYKTPPTKLLPKPICPVFTPTEEFYFSQKSSLEILSGLIKKLQIDLFGLNIKSSTSKAELKNKSRNVSDLLSKNIEDNKKSKTINEILVSFRNDISDMLKQQTTRCSVLEKELDKRVKILQAKIYGEECDVTDPDIKEELESPIRFSYKGEDTARKLQFVKTKSQLINNERPKEDKYKNKNKNELEQLKLLNFSIENKIKAVDCLIEKNLKTINYVKSIQFFQEENREIFCEKKDDIKTANKDLKAINKDLKTKLMELLDYKKAKREEIKELESQIEIFKDIKSNGGKLDKKYIDESKIIEEDSMENTRSFINSMNLKRLSLLKRVDSVRLSYFNNITESNINIGNENRTITDSIKLTGNNNNDKNSVQLDIETLKKLFNLNMNINVNINMKEHKRKSFIQPKVKMEEDLQDL